MRWLVDSGVVSRLLGCARVHWADFCVVTWLIGDLERRWGHQRQCYTGTQLFMDNFYRRYTSLSTFQEMFRFSHKLCFVPCAFCNRLNMQCILTTSTSHFRSYGTLEQRYSYVRAMSFRVLIHIEQLAILCFKSSRLFKPLNIRFTPLFPRLLVLLGETTRSSATLFGLVAFLRP